jgi:segregation and condensation protein B
MSLKARIEAVIYAAEEPVTLAQLAALFGAEALEQKQAREEALAAESAAIAEADAQQADEVIAVPAPGHQPKADESPTQDEAETASPQAPEDAAPAPAHPEAELSPEAAAEAAAAEEKRLARLREREIRDELRDTLDQLIADYATSHRGMEIREVAGGYRVGTKPEYHDSVRAFVKSLKPPIKLSLQALETLAVIAYKQPVTAPEVSEIRGVDSAGVIGSLLSRKLVNTAGRKQVIGRPILYKTTKEFLLRFGLKDLNELPSMEEFEKMAGELADSDAEEPAENENLPFTGEAVTESGETETPDHETGDQQSATLDAGPGEPAASATVSALELATRAELGTPAASTPLSIQVTAEPESEIEVDLPGVEIDAEALDAAPAEEPSEA